MANNEPSKSRRRSVLDADLYPHPVCCLLSDLFHWLKTKVLCRLVPLTPEPGSIRASFWWTGPTPAEIQEAFRAEKTQDPKADIHEVSDCLTEQVWWSFVWHVCMNWQTCMNLSMKTCMHLSLKKSQRQTCVRFQIVSLDMFYDPFAANDVERDWTPTNKNKVFGITTVNFYENLYFQSHQQRRKTNRTSQHKAGTLLLARVLVQVVLCVCNGCAGCDFHRAGILAGCDLVVSKNFFILTWTCWKGWCPQKYHPPNSPVYVCMHVFISVCICVYLY